MEQHRQNQRMPNRRDRPTGPRQPETNNALTPKDIIAILRRHVWLIISLTIIGFMIGGVSWFLLLRYSPKYSASTFIKVLSPAEKDPTAFGRGMATKDVQFGYRQSIAQLIRRPSNLSALLKRDKIQDTKWFKQFGEIKDKRLGKALKDLKKRFGVFADRDAEFVVVSMSCGDAKEAALIVNEMAKMFIATQGTTKRKEVAEKLARFNEQLARLEANLSAAERAMDEVRKRWGFMDLEEGSFESTTTITLNRLELEQNELFLEISEIAATVERFEEQVAGPIPTQVSQQIERDPIMLNLGQQLSAMEARLAGSLTKLGENHRVIRELQEQKKAIEQERELRRIEISERTRQANLNNAKDRLTILQDKYEQLEIIRKEAEATKRDYDLAIVQYKQRLAIRDERKERLNEIKRSIEKLKIMHDDPETPKVQFVGDAPVPLEVSSPKWQVFFPGGIFLGFMIGVGISFLIELLNDLVRTPRDVGRFLHVPLLGVIPDADDDDNAYDVDQFQVLRLAPYSFVSESYRRFRTNLKLSNAETNAKAFLISSAAAGDGRTTVAVNLAMAFVTENKKVLLIDANFWKPNLHTIFKENDSQDAETEQYESEFGLSTLLAGLCGYQEVIRPSGTEGLDIIDAGLLPVNPAELISGPQMEQLIKHQRQIYDYIIIDAPPVLLVGDVKTLAKYVDSTILVFNAATTRRGIAIRMVGELRTADANIAGCVLMAVKAMKGGYFAEQFKLYNELQKAQMAHSV
ncbi:MAG: polysaccharide biosynthesis tyrosine autokinase [Planctomycetes bacterium]|nr:polysaccharide biosynthesis tyrosine autokinase [Planctomycetota bacterium]